MMEQNPQTPAQITDPNGADRRGMPFSFLFFFGCGIAVYFLDNSSLILSVIIILSGLFATAILMESRPYVVLTPEGILVKFLFRQKFYRWQEIPQVGIPRSSATSTTAEYKYPVVVVCPNGYPRKLDTDKFFMDRNIFRAVTLPNRPEIRSFIREHYGPLDFDDTEKLNNWQKRYYGFEKS